MLHANAAGGETAEDLVPVLLAQQRHRGRRARRRARRAARRPSRPPAAARSAGPGGRRPRGGALRAAGAQCAPDDLGVEEGAVRYQVEQFACGGGLARAERTVHPDDHGSPFSVGPLGLPAPPCHGNQPLMRGPDGAAPVSPGTGAPAPDTRDGQLFRPPRAPSSTARLSLPTVWSTLLSVSLTLSVAQGVRVQGVRRGDRRDDEPGGEGGDGEHAALLHAPFNCEDVTGSRVDREPPPAAGTRPAPPAHGPIARAPGTRGVRRSSLPSLRRAAPPVRAPGGIVSPVGGGTGGAAPARRAGVPGGQTPAVEASARRVRAAAAAPTRPASVPMSAGATVSRRTKESVA